MRFPSSAQVDRVAFAAAVAACVFYTLVSFWEISAPLGGGHFAAPGLTAIAGENILQWKVFGYVTRYTAAPPTPDLYYMHHPYGLPVMAAVFKFFFGHHWVTTRLPASVCSALSTVLVYQLGRALWGRVLPAAVATVVFVVMPIDLAFCNAFNLEVPVIFWGLLFTWGTVRHWQTWRRRYLLAAVIGGLGAANCDWIGVGLIGAIGGFAFVRAYVLPRRWFGRLNEREHARWFAFMVLISLSTLLLYLAVFGKANRLSDLLSSYNTRTSGADLPMPDVFGPRRAMWIMWMITPMGLAMVALGTLAALERLFRRGDPYAWIVPAWVLSATFQYFAFKQGADIHIFWPHYYGPCAGLGFGALVASLLLFRDYICTLLSRRVLAARIARVATASLLALFILLPTAALARVGLPLLHQSRMTGGRFDESGNHVETEHDNAQFAEWAVQDMPPGDTISVVTGFGIHNVEYGVNRPLVFVDPPFKAQPISSTERFTLLDARTTSAANLRAIARDFQTTLAGPFWKVDRASAMKTLVALRYDQHQPRGLEWLKTGNDLVRTIGPSVDPFATWEWRHHLDLPAEVPTTEPATIDDLRIAHNIAVSRGDTEGAKALRARIVPSFSEFHAELYKGLHLIGVSIDNGAAALVVTLLWETGPNYTPVDGWFFVRSKVTAPPRLWPSAIDYFEKEVAPFSALGPPLYKPSYLYTQRFVALRRVGKEEFFGFLGSRWGAHLGPGPITLFTLQ